MYIFPSRKMRMLYRRLPIARLAFLTIGIFFTAATIVFAQHNAAPSENSTPKIAEIKPSPKKIAQHTQTTPTPKPTKKVNPSFTPTPIISDKGIGGLILSPTPLTSSPTPTTSNSPTILPTTAPTSPPPSNNATGSILDQVNAYRASQGLGPVQSNSETCNFATTRAQEIISNFSHDGFNSRLSSNTLPYAHWSAVTENIAQTSNPQNVVPMWINSPGHAANMRADTPYVCIQQNGNYYAYEGMKP
jgi:uncharacterized protein YkwD